MENRQKNYGSVHDTKASMMYNRFLKQYNEWLSGGPIPDTGNQDTKYFLGQQRKRLEKRGLHRDSSIELRGLLASAGAIPPKVGKKYTNVTEFRTAQRNTTYSRGGRIIGKFRKKEILYQTITFANEATVDGTEPCTCPSCGAVSQIKALFKDSWESLVGNCDELLYLGGNEKETHKYISELLGKETIDTNTYGQTKGRSGSYSTNFQQSGRELLMPDEVRMLDNQYALLFVRGERAMKDKKYIFSVGDDAYEMYEKAPGNIQIIFPMKNGVIARFDDMQYLLGDLLKEERPFIRGAEYVIAVPTDVTEVEKKAFYDLVLHSEAKAKSVRIVERGLADGLGLGIDVLEEPGAFIANLGGGTTELSVLSYGGIVMNRLLKIGGEQLDSAIANLVRHSKDFIIGRPTAERLRKEFGVFDQSTGSFLTVYGRDMMRGGPSHIDIPISLVRAAIKEPLRECVQAIHSMLDRTPPDVRRNINKNGIYITGGLANLRGISTYLEESIGLPVHMKTDPELCAVKGLQRIILNKTLYRKLSYSMLDEDYRWLR